MRRRWEVELKGEAARLPLLGRGHEWELLPRAATDQVPYVRFSVFCNGDPVLELREAKLEPFAHPDLLVQFDEDLRRIPGLDRRSDPDDIAAMLSSPETRCFVEGCWHPDIDRDGPVYARPFGMVLAACRPHRAALAGATQGARWSPP